MSVPLKPASDAISRSGARMGSISSGEYRPGTSPADRRLLTSSRNVGSTNWWSSSSRTTWSPSIPACCITWRGEVPEWGWHWAWEGDIAIGQSKLLPFGITLDYCEITVKSFNFVGMLFCGLTTLDMFMDKSLNWWISNYMYMQYY